MKMKLIMWVAAFALPFTIMAQEKTKDMKTLIEEAKLSCKLTTPELQQRKKTVIAELKNQVLEKTETDKGFKYKFNGSDKMLDLLNSFIKTERLCCSFFVFNLTASSDNCFAWLELSGPKGTKNFIKQEMEF
ncbi:MAG: hypothetical protein DI539_18345 [Flavobacterium psychrophilum]|nr:MAG: hypothetical protein DI539_18345 [Flavobacterium psychrophilum]